ncbi:transmembrane protein 233-like [Talpa occidentalis]|uniref:transmembrane protein 233-like n=1 Tax=Talpa occidentalis TaxID=50954 RepID=UPI001890B1FE|nr:transmembrane protein 233-like [Talpa occidentalis]XP_037373924.1 transmembrane protein 233-like [Talpa occidentalis]XP_037373925.1 transmembrane protein 233-like [Talpa occidentalis]
MPEQSPPNHPVEDFLPLSIVSLFCCLPLGIIALIFTIRTQSANNYGDRVKAEKNSKTAFTLGITSIILGLIAMFFTAALRLFMISELSKRP